MRAQSKWSKNNPHRHGGSGVRWLTIGLFSLSAVWLFVGVGMLRNSGSDWSAPVQTPADSSDRRLKASILSQDKEPVEVPISAPKSEKMPVVSSANEPVKVVAAPRATTVDLKELWNPSQYDFVWTENEDLLPEFWKAPPGVDLDETGYFLDGQPSVFLMVASYRDFQCRETITSAFERAAHPNRLIVAAVEQNVPGDTGCTEPFEPCEKDPDQALCKYRDQIRLFRVAAAVASGPVFARHVGDRMYRGEYYAMQVDAHVAFIRNWDELMISQFHETKNEYAILSTYLTDIQNSIDKNGDSLRKTRPIMCNSHFEGNGMTSHLRHLAQPEEVPVIQEQPMLQPFWAAGMSFSRGHFFVRVPYDCCLPTLFQGEEISIGIRAWSHGYDLYAPRDSVVFHEYAVNSKRRKGIHTFWENRNKGADPARAMRRMVALIKMAPDLDPSSYDHKDEDLYGLGKVRPVEEFYRLFGMDVRKKSMVPELCKFVKSGIMHQTFNEGLRDNGKGIDYTLFEDFDVAAAINAQLARLQSSAETHLRGAMGRQRPAQIRAALDEARRSRLDKAKPELIKMATELLDSLKR